ncbi:MAG: PucR family transcriptional regulator ligand-binding domain-containing protein [Oscillibacter sp.]
MRGDFVPIQCGDLLELPSFGAMTLVAGRGGLQRKLTWPYVGQTASVAQWVHGGELLFITGIGAARSPESLLLVAQECVAKGLCGLVILVGDEYIKEIPAAVIAVAEEAGLPLFRMPFDLKIIDVTSEIVDLIMQDKYERKRSKGFLERLLFADSGDTIPDDELAQTYSIDLAPYRFVGIFYIGTDEGSVLDFPQMDKLKDSIQTTITGLCKQNGTPILSLASGSNLICLLSGNTPERAQKQADYLRTVHQMLTHLYAEEDIYLSLGRICTADTPVITSYQQSLRALEICKCTPRKERIVAYDDLGVYRLFLQVSNPEELRRYYRYYLEPLQRYDRENRGDLIETLHQYLKNDGNLVRTSQEMFIHRNTLVYRMNKIRELTGRSLDDATEKLELYNSILAKNFLGE